MASRWRNAPHSRSTESPAGPGAAGEPLEELPRWMRLYIYGVHGVALDVLLSSVQGALTQRDPKLLGFSSPYLCVTHALTHCALEKIYSQKSSFRARPAVFHLLFYPSVYIGLQILVGNVSTLSGRVRLVSGSQLVLHYVLAVYFSRVFHAALARLRYRPAPRSLQELSSSSSGGGSSLPGFVRFLFFGMHGFLDEVLFTSLFNLVEKSDGSLGGHTSLWSFLMYGSCSFAVEKLYIQLRFVRGWGTWRRLPVYICLVYTWEFCWGLALRQFDACSWDYSHYPHNFMGLITLLYLPGWVILSLYQDVLSNALLRIRCTKDVDHTSEENGEINVQLESKKQ